MVNQINQSRAISVDAEIPSKTGTVQTAESLSSSRHHLTDKFGADELIRSLANAYENKRARQVTEWERMWRQNPAYLPGRAVM